MRDINRIKGCLVGGAVGDALGYAVEFSRLKSILREYGPDGITRYDLDRGLARISDDTQMALFTATALLFGETRGRMRGIGAGPDVIPTVGITSVGLEDIEYATENGYRIKLLASAREIDGKVYGNVEPALVPVSHPLASVGNEFNAVFVSGNAVDDLMFYGRGAGPLPTGSAVLGDVIGIARKLEKDSAYDIVPQLRYDSGLEFAGEGSNKYYIRMMVPERAGVLGKIASTFGEYGISIEVMQQKAPYEVNGEQVAPIIFIVYEVEKSRLLEALEAIKKEGVILSIDNIMKVE